MLLKMVTPPGSRLMYVTHRGLIATPCCSSAAKSVESSVRLQRQPHRQCVTGVTENDGGTHAERRLWAGRPARRGGGPHPVTVERVQEDRSAWPW